MNNQKKRGAKSPLQTLKRVLNLMFRLYWPQLIIVFISLLITGFASAFTTSFQGKVIDTIVPHLKTLEESEKIGYLLTQMTPIIIICVLAIIGSFVYSRLMVVISQGTMKHLRDDLFAHMQTLPISYFDRHNHGDIMSRYTNDVDTIRQLISQSLPQITNSSIMMIMVAIFMFKSNWILALVIILFVVFMILVVRFLGTRSGKSFVEQQVDLGALNGYIEEMLEGQKVVKVFNHEEYVKTDFDKKNDALAASATKANAYANILMPTLGNLGYFSYGVTLMFGSVLAINSVFGFTIGALVAFLSYNRMFCNQTTQVSNQFNFVIVALAGAERVFELFDEESEKDEGYVTLVNAKISNGEIIETEERTGIWAWKHPHHDGTLTYTQVKGDVRFFDVDFGYFSDKIVLHNVSLFAKPGQKIAFVGATGAGKTTITNLINRFYDIQDGKIRFDGININKIKKPDLRRALGIVLQDTSLFTGTIMDNIRYGKLDATDEECIEAAKLANADQFIEHLPDGYNTMLTSNGSQLSQGQRQLLSIARAAISNPPVLILDEATSSIDTRTEALVTNGMDKLMEGRTVFVIAHRLSTIKNSKAIMVLDHGVVIERGSHEELIEKRGRYYQLYTGAFELE